MSRYTETALRSFQALASKLRALERDEGVRIEADVPGYSRGGFLFVTRANGRFCLNLCDRVLDEDRGRYLPGGREEWSYVSSPDEALAFIRHSVRRRLRAYAY